MDPSTCSKTRVTPSLLRLNVLRSSLTLVVVRERCHAQYMLALHGVVPRLAIRLHASSSEECLHHDLHVFSRRTDDDDDDDRVFRKISYDKAKLTVVQNSSFRTKTVFKVPKCTWARPSWSIHVHAHPSCFAPRIRCHLCPFCVPTQCVTGCFHLQALNRRPWHCEPTSFSFRSHSMFCSCIGDFFSRVGLVLSCDLPQHFSCQPELFVFSTALGCISCPTCHYP